MKKKSKKQRTGKKEPTEFKRLSVRQLKKQADAVFSLWIRMRDAWEANGAWYNRCFTCGVVYSVTKLQCGHYVPRRWNNTRYHEKNNNCQCVGCNIFKKGNMDEYALQMMIKYGKDILLKLAEEKRKEKKFTKEELYAIIDKYRGKTM